MEIPRRLLGLCAALLATALACHPPSEPPQLPAPARDLVTPAAAEAPQSATLVLAGGCFWCTELVFEALAGVEDVVSGYAGGSADDADYKRVSAGSTDHAEVIRVTYDPSQVSFARLLEVFFSVAHDPTQLDRQGPDRGRQYRSAVFYADEAQRATVAAYIAQLDESEAFPAPIVTTLEPLDAFYPAEDYHQDFVRHNPRHAYVVRNALPKLDKLREQHPDWLR